VVKRVRVLIATTEGPSEIQQITAEDPEVRSVVCLDGTSEALPISADYESFVRKPTGVIERLYGHSSYRTDVSHPISNGRSWQLGVLVAHDLLAAGRLATKGMPADEVLWVTGEVRHNLDVVAVDHAREKLREAAGQLRAAVAAGCGVTLLLPRDNRADIESEIDGLGLGDGLRIETLQSWQSGFRGAERGRKRGGVLAIAVLASAAAGYAAWTWMPANTAAGLDRLFAAPGPPQPATTASAAAPHSGSLANPLPPPPRPAPLPSSPPLASSSPAPPPKPSPQSSPQSSLGFEVFAVELRPPAGTTCGRQRLTGGGLTETVVDLGVSGEFPHRTARDLCDVEFRVRNVGATARHVWVHVHPTLEGTQPRTSEAMIDPGKELTLRVGASPWEAGTPWNATVIVAVDPKTAGDKADQRGVQQVTAALRAANVAYEVATYTAEGAARPYR
jgi:hypothetical protein